MDLKVALFREVIAAAPPTALLASNTSSLSITELGTKIGAADRTIGLHFFNPPPVMELLEVVRGLGTSDETLDHDNHFLCCVAGDSIKPKVDDDPAVVGAQLNINNGGRSLPGVTAALVLARRTL